MEKYPILTILSYYFQVIDQKNYGFCIPDFFFIYLTVLAPHAHLKHKDHIELNGTLQTYKHGIII